MALLALTENLSRADLCDFEVGMAIERTEKEFQYRNGLAKAIGISRSKLFRYLYFRKELPDFIIKDLRVEPYLLARKSAESVATLLAKYGESALCQLPGLWDRVKTGKLAQAKLADALRTAVLHSPLDDQERTRTEL